MSSAEGVVLPKPAIPKTLGILNVIFAVLLILFGLCVGGFTLLAPALQQIGQKAIEDQKAQVENQKKADLKILDDRAKDATTDEEKTTIAKEREAVVNRQVPVIPDMAKATEILKNPKVMGFTVAQIGTGLILHIALLVAGIGLIRLTAWGRTLGVWWAGLQIAQILILAVVNFMVIMPIQQANTAAMIAELKKQAEGPNAPPTAGMTVQTSELTAKFAPAILAGQAAAGIVYPIICLILLQTAGARAACLGGKPRLDPSAEF